MTPDNVIPIDTARRGPKPRPETPCPKHLSAKDLDRVLRFAKHHGYSYERVVWAWMAVRGWWESREKKKRNWGSVTINALKGFWEKQGFPDWMARRSWRGGEHQLTEAAIRKLVEQRRREEQDAG